MSVDEHHPRYFPRWYERMNPLVIGADQNTPFTLFRDRAPASDILHILQPVVRALMSVARGATLIVCVVCALALLNRGETPMVVALLIALLPFLLAFVARFLGGWVRRSHETVERRRRPRSLRAIIGTGRMDTANATELLSAGLSGPELGRGLFLEDMRHAPYLLLLSALLLFLLLEMSFSNFLPLLSLDGALFTLSAAATTLSLLPVIALAQAQASLRRLARTAQRSYFSAIEGAASAGAKAAGIEVWYFSFTAAISLLGLFLAGIALELLFRNARSFLEAPLLQGKALHGGTLLSCLFMAALIGWAMALTRSSRRRLMQNAPRLLNDTGHLLVCAVMAHAHDDLDTLTYARQRCEELVGIQQATLLTSPPEGIL